MAVIGQLGSRQRAAKRRLAELGGVRERGGLNPQGVEQEREEREEREEKGISPSLSAHSLLLEGPGEFRGLGCAGSSGGGWRLNMSSEDRDVLDPVDMLCSVPLWCLGAVLRRRSAADMRAAESERLPFLRRRALKLSLLLDL